MLGCIAKIHVHAQVWDSILSFFRFLTGPGPLGGTRPPLPLAAGETSAVRDLVFSRSSSNPPCEWSGLGGVVPQPLGMLFIRWSQLGPHYQKVSSLLLSV